MIQKAQRNLSRQPCIYISTPAYFDVLPVSFLGAEAWSAERDAENGLINTKAKPPAIKLHREQKKTAYAVFLFASYK